jgi:hypothetical protein
MGTAGGMPASTPAPTITLHSTVLYNCEHFANIVCEQLVNMASAERHRNAVESTNRLFF